MPDRLLDDFGREAVAAIVDFGHHRWLRLKIIDDKPNSDVTMPSGSVVKQVAMAAGLRAQILFWSFHGRAKMRGRMPRPARIVEYGARESDKIGIASSNDRLSLIIASDETDRDGRQVRCSLDGTGERHLIARPDRDLLCRSHAPARDMNGATASRRERFREGDGLIEIPASFGPVGPRYAHADWPLDWKDPADGIKYFEGKTHSVFGAAAVVVFALVGQGREKLMQQITVRAMELDRIETEPGGSPCRLHESVTNGGEPVVIEGDRRILTVCEGDGRG